STSNSQHHPHKQLQNQNTETNASHTLSTSLYTTFSVRRHTQFKTICISSLQLSLRSWSASSSLLSRPPSLLSHKSPSLLNHSPCPPMNHSPCPLLNHRPARVTQRSALKASLALFCGPSVFRTSAMLCSRSAPTSTSSLLMPGPRVATFAPLPRMPSFPNLRLALPSALFGPWYGLSLLTSKRNWACASPHRPTA
ncbi:hypothetical protein K457DRAFT_902833, partial [Linnemannia elongata AG-77]